VIDDEELARSFTGIESKSKLLAHRHDKTTIRRRVTCRSAAWTRRIGDVGFEFQVDVKSSRQASLVDDVAAVGVKVFGKGIETGTKEIDHRNRPLP